MRHCPILLIGWAFLATACSTVEPQTTTTFTPSSPTPTGTPPATATTTPRPSLAPRATPTRILIASPSPSTTPTLNFELPSDCDEMDPTIDPRLYQAYDFAYGACDNPAISPDGSLIAFVTFAPTTSGQYRDGVAPTVKLFFIASSETIQIYQAQCNFLLYPEWTPTGHLVITDVPPDVGCGYTAVYNPAQRRILVTLDGIAYKDAGWTNDRTAFFVLRVGGYGPTCNDQLSGFSLSSAAQLPVITPSTPNTDVYAVIGEPVWMSDNRTLLVTLRDGICSQNEFDCQYRNSYVIAFSLTEPVPRISRPFYDPAIDYSFQRIDEGGVEFTAKPFKPVTCWDIHSTDGT